MLMRAQIGQLFVVGFHGTELTESLRRLLVEFHVGGVILFRRNVVDLEQVWALAGAIRKTCTYPPVAIYVDEEGGPVSRLPAPLLRLPAMRTLGRTGDAGLLRAVGETLGRELTALGVHVDLAPVVDVDTNPKNPVIGPRSLHGDAAEVARLGVALMEGLEAGGVTACPKHFPGHGDTDSDSHRTLPVLQHDVERLEQVELVPFRAAVAAGARMLMTAHVLFPNLDPVHPATLSPLLLPSLLRQRLGYRGLIATDDLDMKAIADRYTLFEAITLGVAGAADLFLLCGDENRQYEALEAALRLAEQDPGARVRMSERAARVLAWKKAHLRRDRRVPDPAALRAVFADPARKALEERLRAITDAR